MSLTYAVLRTINSNSIILSYLPSPPAINYGKKLHILIEENHSEIRYLKMRNEFNVHHLDKQWVATILDIERSSKDNK